MKNRITKYDEISMYDLVYNYHLSTTKIAKYLGVSKQRISQKINHYHDRSFNWEVSELDDAHEFFLKTMIDKMIAYDESDTHHYHILYNGDKNEYLSSRADGKYAFLVFPKNKDELPMFLKQKHFSDEAKFLLDDRFYFLFNEYDLAVLNEFRYLPRKDSQGLPILIKEKLRNEETVPKLDRLIDKFWSYYRPGYFHPEKGVHHEKVRSLIKGHWHKSDVYNAFGTIIGLFFNAITKQPVYRTRSALDVYSVPLISANNDNSLDDEDDVPHYRLKVRKDDNDNLSDEQRLLMQLKTLSAQTKTITNEITKKTRSRTLVRKMKELYNYQCQLCDPENPIPAIPTDEGEPPYVEMHHIIPLSDNNGEDESECLLDDYSNVIVVCSHHHKVLHYQWGGYTKLHNKDDGLYFVNEKSSVKIHLNKHLE